MGGKPSVPGPVLVAMILAVATGLGYVGYKLLDSTPETAPSVAAPPVTELSPAAPSPGVPATAGHLFDPPLVEVGEGIPRGVRVSAGVYLAPFPNFPERRLKALQKYFLKTWALQVKILDQITIERSALPAGNTQIDAFNLADQVLRAYAVTERPTVVIGFLTYDIRVYQEGDNFNFGAVNPSGYAVISTARMDPRSYGMARDDQLMMSRLRKMTTRYIAEVYFGLERNRDARSVLFEDIRGLHGLDRMTKWPCPERPGELVTC